MSKPVTALFGGTFDPVHSGHLNIIEQVLAAKRAAQVIVVPAALPPHKRDRAITADAHRWRMLELALQGLPEVSLSDFELSRPGPSYTVHTAAHFAAVYGDSLRLIIGMDSLRDLHLWYRADDLVRYRFIIYRRPDCAPPSAAELAGHFGPETAARLLGDIFPAPQLAASSSSIRAALAAGKDVGDALPSGVRDYITSHRLYTTAQACEP